MSQTQIQKNRHKSVYCYLQRMVLVDKGSLFRSTAPPAYMARQGHRVWVLIITDVLLTCQKVSKYSNAKKPTKVDFFAFGTSGRTRTATPEETRF